MKTMELRDKKGIPIRLWDVLKVFHFKASNKCYYMYKQVIGITEVKGHKFLIISHLQKPDAGNYLLLVEDKILYDYEIVQGYGEKDDYFLDREKNGEKASKLYYTLCPTTNTP